jgi:DsbC/DsbD-like thiol-disulfide interchange protein
MPHGSRNGGVAVAPWHFADSHNHVSGMGARFALDSAMLAAPRLTIVTMALAVLAGPAAARAQDASPWDKQPHAQARLIAGSVMKSADATYLHAGVEIRLDAGWKTYWREPGDSGVPPTFDFSGSENVKSIAVEWPAPERFPDGAGGNSIGYVGRVVLPLRIVQKDSAKHSSVHLKLNYAVCGNLCVPAEATLELALSSDGAEETALEKEELRVPRRIAPGAGKGLAVISAHRGPGGEHDRVVVEVAAPKDAPLDLFVEGPTPDWSLPLPEPSGTDGEHRRFTFDLDGLPPGASAKDVTLIFTAVSGDDAIEVPIHLD